MQNNNYQSDSVHFDYLMNEAFIHLDFNDVKNELLIQSVAAHVMLSGFYVNNNSFESTSSNSLKSKLWLKIIIASFTVAASVSIVMLFFASNRKPESVNHTIQTHAAKQPKEPLTEFINTINKSHTAVFLPFNRPELPPEKQKQLLFPDKDTLVAKPEQLKEDEPDALLVYEIRSQMNEDTAFVFPKLTEKEVKANNKQKKKMIEQLVKLNKAKYVLLPKGNYKYNGEEVAMNAFYMQAAEITNIEYRTFLFDLLIQERKTEFLKAKPRQMQWVKEFNQEFFKPLAENYFSGTSYNDYPVVNVSLEGAEMFCNWLTNESNRIMKEKGKTTMNEVRLPTDIEWMYAANSAGKSQTIYPWGRNDIRSKNNSGCFYANFCLKKFKGSMDSITIKCNPKAYLNAYTTGGLMLGESTFPVMVYAYNPNEAGLYCMSGNVSEMVYISENKNSTRTMATKGGSWDSSEEQIKINYPPENSGRINGAPYIGFRPVISVIK